ncbi:hypothetical protein MVEG_11162 [Podila verticillata NRRL 6337]|uniref:Sterol methyltransferase C-terminal domain-containing protein n=1 Tax=Podila verticillata NRRL 6337 TaxID=1069443 RepID=A0A086TME8_9FUNG|nr:hypothetical protein MVEG_11162 [Podila verticillata NRRL 6337]
MLEKLHQVPPGSTTVQKILETAADSLVEGAIAGIFTPMFFFVARKPGSAVQQQFAESDLSDI